MRTNKKERAAELARELQGSRTHEADAARELVDIMFEDAKNSLVNSNGEDTLRLQGEARAFERLYRQLTVPSPVKPQEQ